MELIGGAGQVAHRLYKMIWYSIASGGGGSPDVDAIWLKGFPVKEKRLPLK